MVSDGGIGVVVCAGFTVFVEVGKFADVGVRPGSLVRGVNVAGVNGIGVGEDVGVAVRVGV